MTERLLEVRLAMSHQKGGARYIWPPPHASGAEFLRIPGKSTMRSGAWRPLDPADNDQGSSTRSCLG